MPTKSLPTPGAMRAAEVLSQRLRKMGGTSLINTNAELLAGIIDAESGLPEMLEVLEAYIRGDYTDGVIGLTAQFDEDVHTAIKKAGQP